MLKDISPFVLGALFIAIANGLALYRRPERRLLIAPPIRFFLSVSSVTGVAVFFGSFIAAFFVYKWYWIPIAFITVRVLAGLIYHPLIAKAEAEEASLLDSIRTTEDWSKRSTITLWERLPVLAAMAYGSGFTMLAIWAYRHWG